MNAAAALVLLLIIASTSGAGPVMQAGPILTPPPAATATVTPTLSAVVIRAAHYRVAVNGMKLPDPAVTPGVVALTDKATVCGIAWGKDVRHVTETMKLQVCRAYGIGSKCPGPAWEIDHLVSRELGGADDVRNLWPEPIAEARGKDRVENWLHRQVCAGKMSLAEAQKLIRLDWTRAIAPASGR